MSQAPGLPVLPAVEHALKPFIKPPSEITAIRRNLNSTLESLIASSASATPSLTSQRAIRCLSGTRKAYYNAAVENLRLRKQWADLASDIKIPLEPPSQAKDPKTTLQAAPPPTHSRSHSRKISMGQALLPTDWTQVYDQVLELRRVFSQLTILNKYQQRITALAQQQNQPLTGIFADHNQKLPAAPLGGPLAKEQTFSTAGGGGAGAEDDILLPLEKAVVDAKARLEKERKLLQEIKESTKGIDMESLPEEVKTAGMVAAKGELEMWLDEQLRLAGEESKTPRKERKDGDLVGGEVWEGDEKFNFDKLLEEIKKGYEDYVESREKMLHAFVLAMQPVKKGMIPPKMGKDRNNSIPGGGLAGGDMPQLLGLMDELGHSRDRTNELSDLINAMKDGSARAGKDLENTMARLRSESQLIDNFGGGVAIRPRSMTEENMSPFHGSVELAKTWELAAAEAERNLSDEVGKGATYAQDKLAEVEQMLEKLRTLLPEGERSSNRRRRDVSWRGLKGNVGFDDAL
ncbi:hypothetical protein H072_5259 [Dactylellina haptotyla CBS 200.50]|uniref:Uncharacterized protein n=1 Tax=Dactylellina haptotyla (strain CBS 200.50) TaxID=1284197 RepID=S8BMY3_DACHA|nr:hypothetical protein H072_5259 [Dactylellina haptotyla CBS 200.50]